MKLKETVTAPIPVLVTYGLYSVCYASSIASDALKRYGDYTLISGIVMLFLTLAIPAVLYAKIKGVGYSEKMRFASFNPSRSIFALCAAICALSGAVLVAVCMNSFSPVRYSLVSTYAMSISDASLPVLYRMMAYAIIPALAEEFLYRGILFTEYRENGTVCAVIFSSLLFALGQFSAEAFLPFFALGALMAFVYYVTDSFVLTVAVRVVFNSVVFFFEDASWLVIQRQTDHIFFLTMSVAAFLIFAALGLSEAQRIFFKCALDAKKSPAGVSKKEKLAERLAGAVLSPTFILCVMAAIAINIFA